MLNDTRGQEVADLGFHFFPLSKGDPICPAVDRRGVAGVYLVFNGLTVSEIGPVCRKHCAIPRDEGINSGPVFSVHMR